jgi:hypothetical protein
MSIGNKTPRIVIPQPQYSLGHESIRNSQIEQALRDLHSRIDESVQWVADNFAVASYAAMYDAAISISSLGAGWSAFTGWDSSPFTSKDITLSLSNGTAAFDQAGVFLFSFMVDLDHDSNVSLRNTQFRLYDVTGTAQKGNAITRQVLENVTGTNVTLDFLAEVTTSEIGNTFRIEAGNGSTIASVGGSAHLSIHQVSQWSKTIPVI